MVHQAAQILANHEQDAGTQVRWRYLAFVDQMQKQKADLESLGEAIGIFVISPTTSQLASFSATTSKGYHERTMNWNIALEWHGSMSDEPRADGEPFLASSSVDLCAS